MKKQPGINGKWVPVSPEYRLSQAVIPSLVTLGTPAIIQVAVSVDAAPDDYGWLLVLIFWIYGLLFWINSAGINLFRTQRWEWHATALAEQRQYRSDAREQSQAFWAHWWVRFPIGIVFLALGLQALMSKDFSLQLMSLVLLLSAFVTPFVFMVELVLLPLCLGLVVGLLAVVTQLPVSVIVILSVLGLVAIILTVKSRRTRIKQVLEAHKSMTEAGSEKKAKADSTAPAAPDADPVAIEDAAQNTGQSR